MSLRVPLPKKFGLRVPVPVDKRFLLIFQDGSRESGTPFAEEETLDRLGSVVVGRALGRGRPDEDSEDSSLGLRPNDGIKTGSSGPDTPSHRKGPSVVS